MVFNLNNSRNYFYIAALCDQPLCFHPLDVQRYMEMSKTELSKLESKVWIPLMTSSRDTRNAKWIQTKFKQGCLTLALSTEPDGSEGRVSDM